MKKLLLASTALIGFAGVAAAEVAIEGTAEMGFTGGDLKETQFHNSYTINFKMSGETDTGLSFGATYRLDADGSSEENQNPVGDNGTVWISGAFGKLTLGDTNGALDWALTETAMGTAITDEGTTHVGYSGNGDNYYDDQVLRYEYAFGDFGVALSVEQDDGNSATSTGDGDPMIGLGGKYKAELGGVDLSFGLGYQTGDTLRYAFQGVNFLDAIGVQYVSVDVLGVSAKAAMDNGFSAVVNYVTYDYGSSVPDLEHYGLGLGYEMGALLVHANWGKWEIEDFDSFDSFGLIANYDLGGGAILAAGYASDVSTDDGDQDQFSLGLSLSF
ncbi:porin [Frigidibacter albus]